MVIYIRLKNIFGEYVDINYNFTIYFKNNKIIPHEYNTIQGIKYLKICHVDSSFLDSDNLTIGTFKTCIIKKNTPCKKIKIRYPYDNFTHTYYSSKLDKVISNLTDGHYKMTFSDDLQTIKIVSYNTHIPTIYIDCATYVFLNDIYGSNFKEIYYEYKYDIIKFENNINNLI